MALSDILTPSFAFSLAICLLLTGLLGVFFTQKFAEQNHKMSSMLELVSTLANEMNMMRAHLSRQVNFTGGANVSDGPSSSNSPIHNSIPGFTVLDENLNNMMFNCTTDADDDIKLISVSDDADYDDDDSDADSNDNSDDDSSSSDSSDNDNASIDSEDSADIDIDEVDINDIDINVKNNKINIQDQVYTTNENISINDENDDENDIKILNFDEFCIEEDGIENTKNIDVVLDYKKASLNKLRSIVLDKGLVSDASKLKKPDLLKMLEKII